MEEISKGLGLDANEFGFVVSGAGGVGEIVNGRYTERGTYNGKPIYRNDNDMAIYFSAFWKIGCKDTACVWLYAVKDAIGPKPPTGAWTTYGYTRTDAEPAPSVASGVMPDAVPCDSLFAWLSASQPVGCESEPMSRSRFAGKLEREVFDEVVRLLNQIDFQGDGGVLCHAPPGPYSGTAPVEAGAWLLRVVGTGEWESWDGTRRGNIRIVADTEVPDLSIQVSFPSGNHDDAPARLEPASLEFYTLEHDNYGTSIRACFQIGVEPNDVHWEVFIHGSGIMQGWYRSSTNDGSVKGKATGEFRPHTEAPPVEAPEEPTALTAGLIAEGLVAKRATQPMSVEWEVPEAVAEGKVVLVALGGPPCSGKGTLAERILQALLKKEVAAKIVGQDAYCYTHLEEIAQGMVLTPGMVRWQDFFQGLDQEVAQVAKVGTKTKPGVVLLDGPLLYWMRQLDSVLRVRFFLRTSRNEFFRRQRAKAAAAGRASAPSGFLEHVAWPAHLAWGQPRQPPHILDVPDGIRAGPLPREVLENAVEVLQDCGILPVYR